MEVSIVSRTTSSGRCLEYCSLSKTEAEELRQNIIKRYEGYHPSLCLDTEVETFRTDVWVVTKTKAYGCTGEDPMTVVIRVGSRDECLKYALAEVDVVRSCIDGEVEGDAEEGWRGVDSEEDAVYIIKLHCNRA